MQSTDDPLTHTRSILDNFTVAEWPDLTASRFPAGDPTDLEQTIVDAAAASRTPSRLLTVVARLLGSYVGSSDVLLAYHQPSGPSPSFIRVQWNETTTWCEAIEAANRGIIGNGGKITLTSIRRVLDLSDKVAPCLALCSNSPDAIRGHVPEYPLHVHFDEDKLLLSLFTTTAFAHPSVSKQIIAQVAALLEHASCHASSPMQHLTSLPKQLLSVYDSADPRRLNEYYPNTPIVTFAFQYLEKRAVTNPDAVAVRWYPELSMSNGVPSFESVTYCDFNTRSNDFARYLLRKGLKSEGRVAVCMQRNLDFYVVMMGVMKAGGCYVPIDPDLPAERKLYIAKDSGALFVLTTSECSPPSLFGPNTIYVDKLEVPVNDTGDRAVGSVSPESLAYLLYTSGTTGTPKGCLLTHHGLAQAIVALSYAAAQARMDNLSRGRWLAVASIAFDVHLAETFVPLVLGMPLLSVQRSQLLENLPHYIKILGITHVGIVPSLIEATMGALQTNDASSLTLRYIASGGEKMSDAILDKWADHPQVLLANFYGPSEATIGCNWRIMDSITPRANIGRPFANSSAYVVDRDMNVVPRGGVGELVISGPLVGRGYQGRPDLTQKVFLAWPSPEKWSYRTGDLVRMMPDSTIEILGRIDTQIKLRGVRIESEGISAIVRKAVSSSPTGFLDAATVLGKHPNIGTEQLISFVTWDPAIPISVRKASQPYILDPPSGLLDSIKRICEAEIASYMRPSHIIPISWLPLSSNGKSDNKTLVAFFNGLNLSTLGAILTGGHGGSNTARPATKRERDVCAILQRHVTFPLKGFLPQTNIFECGMDSLTISQFTADLKRSLGIQLTASDVMKAPTISGIAAIIDDPTKARIEDSDDVSPLASKTLPEVLGAYKDVPTEQFLPPYTVQEGVLSRSSVNGTLYVQHVVLRPKYGLSLKEIQSAWETVMRATPILRTVFHFGRALTQVVLAPDALPLPWLEESAPSSSAISEWFMSSHADEISQSINDMLSDHPPWQLHAYSSSGDTMVVLSIHHSLYDGISLPILINEVERACMGEKPRPQPSSAAILRYLHNKSPSDDERYWKAYFEDFQWPGNALITDSERKSKHAKVEFRSRLSQVKDLAGAKHVTIQALLTAAFAEYAMVRIYQKLDITFGVIRSGRLLPIEHIGTAICPMIAVLPFRVKLNRSTDILAEIQDNISTMVAHEHTPLGRIQNWTRPGKSLFELMFSVSVSVDVGSEAWDAIESEPPAADFALSAEVILNPMADSLCIQVVWIPGCFEDSTIFEFLKNFENDVFRIGKEGRLRFGTLSGVPGMCNSPEESIGADSGEQAIEANLAPYDIALGDKLRDIIADFLLIDNDILTERTSFVSLGLDSIKAVGLAKQLRNAGYQLSAVDLMRVHTIALLASHISTSAQTEKYTEDTVIKESVFRKRMNEIQGSIDQASLRFDPSDDVAIYPATALQTGLLSQTINSQGRLYVHAFPMRLYSQIDYTRLKQAWCGAVERLSILRTTFHFIHALGTWIQVVHSTAELTWSESTLHPTDDFTTLVRRTTASVHPLDEKGFSSAPPILIHLFRSTCNETPSRLVLVMHHSLYDGLSIGKLTETVAKIYHGDPISSPTQFTDLLEHCIYQEEQGTSFWVSHLKDYRVQLLPLRSDISSPVVAHAISKEILLDSDLIQGVLRAASVTAQCLGQAAWARTWADVTKSDDIVFGHTVSGRSLPNAEDIIGPVLNTIPCRVLLRPDMSNLDLLKLIHKHNVAALPWHHAALRSVQRELGASRLWDSLFLFQPSVTLAEQHAPWTWDDVMDQTPEIQYPVNIELHQRSSGFFVQIACRSDYLDPAGVQSVLQHFEQALQSIVRSPGKALSQSLDFSSLSSKKNTYPSPAISTSLALSSFPDDQVAAIRSILSGLTNLPSSIITLDSSLAALGVDSITAIQIVAKCRAARLEVTASDVVRSTTVADLLSTIQEVDESTNSATRRGIELPENEKKEIISTLNGAGCVVENVLPLSPGMKWLIGAWERSSRTRFQHAFAYALAAGTDIVRLRNAWAALVERHAILRSTFISAGQGRECRLVVLNSSGLDFWSEEGLPAISEEVVKANLLKLLETPYCSQEPPTRALVLNTDDEAYLLVRLHHFQYDAWSLQLLLHDLTDLYLGNPPVISNRIDAFIDAVNDVGTFHQEQRQYWQTTFTKSFIPRYFPPLSKSNASSMGRTIYTNPRAIPYASRYEKKAQDLRLSLQAVFLAAWAKVQMEISCSEDATFGLWHSGRTGTIDDIARLAVPCINILPVHVPAGCFRDVLRLAVEIQASLKARSAAVEQSDLESIHRWLGVEGKPLCNVFVNVVKIAPDVASSEVDSLFGPIEVPYAVPAIPPEITKNSLGHQRSTIAELIQDDLLIDIAVVSDKDAVLVSLDSSPHILDASHAEGLVARWSELVLEALSSPST